MIIIELPWFQNDTRPNARKHWTARSKAKNIDKELGYHNAFPLKNKVKSGNISLSITYHPSSNRHMDLDNCLAGCKGQIDGIALGLGVNDKNFRPITIDFGEVIKNGKVVYKFEST